MTYNACFVNLISSPIENDKQETTNVNWPTTCSERATFRKSRQSI